MVKTTPAPLWPFRLHRMPARLQTRDTIQPCFDLATSSLP